jgi:hypothetical protein
MINGASARDVSAAPSGETPIPAWTVLVAAGAEAVITDVPSGPSD